MSQKLLTVTGLGVVTDVGVSGLAWGAKDVLHAIDDGAHLHGAASETNTIHAIELEGNLSSVGRATYRILSSDRGVVSDDVSLVFGLQDDAESMRREAIHVVEAMSDEDRDETLDAEEIDSDSLDSTPWATLRENSPSRVAIVV